MKPKILFIVAIISALAALASWSATAQTNLAQKLSGRILLQVETLGQAWYVNPADQKRYFLGRPADAFNIMRSLGIGITNDDLIKIPTENQAPTNLNFAKLNAGKIFLQIQGSGEAWYINPTNLKRYFLGRPQDAWRIMRTLALGITNKNIEQIAIGQLTPIPPIDQPPATPLPDQPPVQESVLDQAASSIRSNDATKAQAFFVEPMRKSIEYSIRHLSSESRLLLANILSGAKLASSGETEKIYATTAYFSLGGYEVPLRFSVKKQADGKWLIANL